ncbi:hypothetical protein [Magnetospirillum sp. 15-1]|uniref:hypothetical protein n=1 Tax=Magnetospirillum sp. 15-1 TaxID=1979370 RepID=UPI001144DBFB|nr:hypothetical protein [Magnetospirillum sp. 15-1]
MMTRSTIPHRLAAIYNPTKTSPAFVFPAFVFAGANTHYIQNLDADGNVESFEPLDVNHAELVSITDISPVVKIGDPAIWAFQVGDGAFLIGEEQEIVPQLDEFLNNGAFHGAPLTELEVVEFCKRADMVRPALQNSFSYMSRISEKAATYSRPITKPHSRYVNFADYGDAEGYRQRQDDLRRHACEPDEPPSAV